MPDSATRRLIMQKARRHPINGAPTACRRTVSGTLSLPCSGCFSPFPHGTGSLSVSQEYLALRDGPRGFRQGFSCPALLRGAPKRARCTRTGLSPTMAALSSALRFACPPLMASLQPHSRRNGGGLGCSPFARRYLGNHSCFLLLRVLRCFSSPGLPPDCSGYQAFSLVGCPIRTPADRWVCAPPRGFSQLVASFIASESLGIPRAPLITFRALARPVFARFCPHSFAKKYKRAASLRRSLLFISHHHHVKELLSQKKRLPVENNGFEPLTPCVQGRCSSQLS